MFSLGGRSPLRPLPSLAACRHLYDSLLHYAAQKCAPSRWISSAASAPFVDKAIRPCFGSRAAPLFRTYYRSTLPLRNTANELKDLADSNAGVQCLANGAISESKDLADSDAGEQYFANGDFLGAAKHYTALIEKDPTNSVPFLHRGEAFYRSGDLDASEADFKQTVLLDPSCTVAHMRLGYISLSKAERQPQDAGRYLQQALESFTTALTLEPSSADCLYGKGLALARHRQWKDAIKCFDDILSIDKSYAPAHKARAEALYSNGDYVASIAAFDSFLDMFIPYYEKASSAVPDKPAEDMMADTLLQVGMAHMKASDPDAARIRFSLVIQMQPANRSLLAMAHHLSGAAFRAVGKWWQVIDENTKALQVDKDFAKAYKARSEAFDMLGKTSDSVEDLKMYKILVRSAAFGMNRTGGVSNL